MELEAYICRTWPELNEEPAEIIAVADDAVAVYQENAVHNLADQLAAAELNDAVAADADLFVDIDWTRSPPGCSTTNFPLQNYLSILL